MAADDRISRVARQLSVAQQITHIGSWEWDVATGVVSWSDELYRIYGLEPRSVEVTFEWFLSRLHPEDRDRVAGAVQRALVAGGVFSYPERIVRPDGTVRDVDTIGEVVTGADGRPTGLIGTCRDVTELRRSQRVQAGERKILEMLAAGTPLGEILAEVVRLIESLEARSIASILLLDDSGRHLKHGAAPGLPPEYNAAIDGAAIGPMAGSCGTAAFLRKPVIVSDIATDPLWQDYRELALPHGLRACWSTPILANDGRVLGTFAMYDREVRTPDDAALELIARATHIAAIVIERRTLDDQLRALSERIEAVREDERTGIAREIHDELGQALTALKMDLAWVARRIGDGQGAIADKLASMSQAADGVIQSVRRISAELRPGVLDDLGLLAAIEWQSDQFTSRTGVPCRVESNLGDDKLDRDLSTGVFRIFQEALTNVTRHAHAHEVRVALMLERGMLRLEVSDDGVGLREPANPRSLGLLGMCERARRLGGDCTVTTREPTGTVVRVLVPFRAPARVATVT